MESDLKASSSVPYDGQRETMPASGTFVPCLMSTVTRRSSAAAHTTRTIIQDDRRGLWPAAMHYELCSASGDALPTACR